jgi:hypothetical protein
MRTVALAVAGLVWCGSAFGQLPNGQPVSNPIPAPTGEPGALPGGTEISRPLTPVGPPPVEPPPVVLDETPAKPVKIEKVQSRGPLGPWWDTDELLLWWPKSHPLPTLVTGTRTGAVPVIGGPDTQVLVGEGTLANQVVAGGRFVRGWSLNQEQTVGLEFAYFFLGSRTSDVTVASLNSRFSHIGLPYTDAFTGREDAITIASPNGPQSYLTVGVTSRVQGFEANFLANLFARDRAKLHFLAGYRYFQLNEGLRIEQTYIEAPPFRDSTMIGRAADQFDTANRFSGGQLGLQGDFNRGPFFVEVVGKVAFGQNFEVVRIGGETHTVTVGNGPERHRSFQSGMYAQPGNTARVTNAAFAVVPEGIFKVGLKTGDRSRFYAAYNFLYLSDAVRPGDQVDRTLSASQVPLLTGVRPGSWSDRPVASVNRTDFWVQGVVIGFEGRY